MILPFLATDYEAKVSFDKTEEATQQVLGKNRLMCSFLGVTPAAEVRRGHRSSRTTSEALQTAGAPMSSDVPTAG